jgi:hypothetical protein
MFQIPLALTRWADTVMRLSVNEKFYLITLRETLHEAFFMFMDAPHQIIGHTNIKRPIPPARHDVNVIGHERSIAHPAPRGTPGKVGAAYSRPTQHTRLLGLDPSIHDPTTGKFVI